MRSWNRIIVACGLVCAGCSRDPAGGEPVDTSTSSGTPMSSDDADPDTGAGTSGRPSGSDGPGPSSETTPGTDTDPDTDTGPGPDPTSSSGGVEPEPGDRIHEESFDGPDGSDWPDPWARAGSQVTIADLSGGRARLSGNTGNVARMVLPGFEESDVEVLVTIDYDDFFSQGIGFYVRQNGGALLETDPPGEGYAVFVEGGFMQHFGIWREREGDEDRLSEAEIGDNPPQGPQRVRFQCFTEGSRTRLRGRMWPVGTNEPDGWLLDITDDTPELQGIAGSFAVDIYNYAGDGSIYVDDLIINRLTPG